MTDKKKTNWGRRYSDNQAYPKGLDSTNLPKELSPVAQKEDKYGLNWRKIKERFYENEYNLGEDEARIMGEYNRALRRKFLKSKYLYRFMSKEQLDRWEKTERLGTPRGIVSLSLLGSNPWSTKLQVNPIKVKLDKNKVMEYNTNLNLVEYSTKKHLEGKVHLWKYMNEQEVAIQGEAVIPKGAVVSIDTSQLREG